MLLPHILIKQNQILKHNKNIKEKLGRLNSNFAGHSRSHTSKSGA